jgi:hypothetical protein
LNEHLGLLEKEKEMKKMKNALKIDENEYKFGEAFDTEL